MRAVNPFLVLDIDEDASRAEIDEAHRRLVRQHHPDRFAAAGEDAQREASRRTAELNEAHRLLTDPAAAEAHRRTIQRVRAAGHHVPPPPHRSGTDVPSDPSPRTDRSAEARRAALRREKERQAGGGSFSASEQGRTSFTAGRRRWFRRG